MNINKEEIEKANKNLTNISWTVIKSRVSQDPTFDKDMIDDMNALDYFMNSSFYEKNSINEKCRKQQIDFNFSHYQFTGIEFILEAKSSISDPNIFTISKQYRNSPNSAVLISFFYICSGVIYQAPNLFNVLTRNIENLSNNMLMILKTVKDKQYIILKIYLK